MPRLISGARKRPIKRPIMRNHVLIIFFLVCCFRRVSQAQEASSIPTFTNDNTQQIAPQGPQLQNPATGTMPPIAPGGTGLNSQTIPGSGQINPGPLPANELIPLPNDLNSALAEMNQKFWRLTYTLGTGLFYDDNIFISSTGKKPDTVFTIDGGIDFELGDYRYQTNDYLIARYLVTGYLYTRHPSEDSADQYASVLGQYRFSGFTFKPSFLYQYVNQPDRFVGTITRHQYIDGNLALLYDLSPKTQLHAGFEQITNLYGNFLSSFEYIGRFGADYLITPKIKLGLEGIVGSLHQEGSPANFYGQARLRAAYAYTGKLTFRASVGEEVRHYSGNHEVKGTPVFSLGADWNLFLDTQVSLDAYRSVYASPLTAGDDYTATGASVTLSQKLLNRFNATAVFGYENDKYNSTTNSAVNTTRTDNYVYIGPSLTYTFRSWLTASVYYQFRRTDSNTEGASFTENRIGEQISITF
jgi:Putative beta-barrel porin 2